MSTENRFRVLFSGDGNDDPGPNIEDTSPKSTTPITDELPPNSVTTVPIALSSDVHSPNSVTVTPINNVFPPISVTTIPNDDIDTILNDSWSDKVDRMDERITFEHDIILHDVNLNQAAYSHDSSTILDDEITVSNPRNSSHNHYSLIHNNPSTSVAPNIQSSSSRLSISTTDLTLTISGSPSPLHLKNSIAVMKELNSYDHSLRPDQIKVISKKILIKCSNLNQLGLLLNCAKIEGKFVDVQRGDHTLKPQTLYQSVIIHGVDQVITNEDISMASKACHVRRLMKKDNNVLVKTKSVILTYPSDPPNSITLGYKTHLTKVFIQNPIRCNKCQVFGHIEKHCKGNISCPICAQHHAYNDCSEKNKETVSFSCSNCNANHSAGYRSCEQYIDAKKIMEIKTVEKIPYYKARQLFLDRKTSSDSVTSDPLPSSSYLRPAFQVPFDVQRSLWPSLGSCATNTNSSVIPDGGAISSPSASNVLENNAHDIYGTLLQGSSFIQQHSGTFQSSCPQIPSSSSIQVSIPSNTNIRSVSDTRIVGTTGKAPNSTSEFQESPSTLEGTNDTCNSSIISAEQLGNLIMQLINTLSADQISSIISSFLNTLLSLILPQGPASSQVSNHESVDKVTSIIPIIEGLINFNAGRTYK